MNFLKKLGSLALKIIGLWAGFSPLVSQSLSGSPTGQKVVGEITQAFGVIDTVEKMATASAQVPGTTPMTPSQKLASASPFVAQLIQGTDMLIGKKPKDETMFISGVQDFVNAMVKILNSYGE